MKKIFLIIALFVPIMQLPASQNSQYAALAIGTAGVLGTGISGYFWYKFAEQFVAKSKSSEYSGYTPEEFSTVETALKNEKEKAKALSKCKELNQLITQQHELLEKPQELRPSHINGIQTALSTLNDDKRKEEIEFQNEKEWHDKNCICEAEGSWNPHTHRIWTCPTITRYTENFKTKLEEEELRLRDSCSSFQDDLNSLTDLKKFNRNRNIARGACVASALTAATSFGVWLWKFKSASNK